MRPVFALLTLLTALCSAATSSAAIVTLTLDPASSTANTLDLAILDGAAETALSGTIEADLDIDLTTGVISGFRFNSGTIAGTGWSMPVPALGGLTIVATASTATAETNIAGYSPVTGSTFSAAQHQLLLTGGQVTNPPPPVDLNGTTLLGDGNGTITSTLNGDQYEIFLAMTINDTDTISGQTLTINGPLVARGSVTAIPEPTAAFALAGALSVVCMGRRRRRR